MLACGVEECTEWPGYPYLPWLGKSLAWPLGALDRVGRQELVNDNGVTERLPQHGVDVFDGARG